MHGACARDKNVKSEKEDLENKLVSIQATWSGKHSFYVSQVLLLIFGSFQTTKSTHFTKIYIRFMLFVCLPDVSEVVITHCNTVLPSAM